MRGVSRTHLQPLDPDISSCFFFFFYTAYPHDTGIDSGLFDNVFDDGSDGTQYIQSINDMPHYSWTYAQPDTYGAEAAETPTTLAE